MFNGWLTERSNRQRLATLSPRLRRLAFAWCGDEHLADDLTQETLSKALSSLHTLKRDTALEGWAFSILANCFRDHCRRNRAMDPFEEHADDSQLSSDDQITQQQTVLRVQQAVAKLSPPQREVLMLIDLESCSYAEVANILGIPVGTVMSRLSRARQTLKQFLQPVKRTQTTNRPFMERIK
jgi:RNA polymerase sigma-70 factor (ECF subfamily)